MSKQLTDHSAMIAAIHDAYGAGEPHHQTGEMWNGVGEWRSRDLREEGINSSDLPSAPPAGATWETHIPIRANGKVRYVSKKDHPAFFAKLQRASSTHRAQYMLWGHHERAAKMKMPPDQAFLDLFPRKTKKS